MAQQTVGIGTFGNDSTGDSLRVAGEKINENFTELYQGERFGLYAYENTLTSQSFIGTPIVLNNNGAGTNTTTTYKLTGLDNIFNTTTNSFDFSSLVLGDSVNFRVDVEVTTTTSKQEIDVYFDVAIGTASNYSIYLIKSLNIKTFGTHTFQFITFLSMLNNDTKNNDCKIMFNSTANATVKLTGKLIKAEKRKL